MTSRLTFSSRRTTPMAITLQSPNEIEVLIHCHCTPGPHPRAHAPAVQYALNKLAECGAIEGAVGPKDLTTEARHHRCQTG